MLTALEIENFKGIAARQRIDFAPLTLLFGANSAGKSTIMQALLYLHELIERGSADVDRTELGGSALDLGGFARLVHRHETERSIVLRAEFATPGRLDRFRRDLPDFPFPDLDDEVDSAWMELTVRFRRTPTFRGPLVERAVIGVNDSRKPLVWLELGPSLRDGDPLHVRVNLGHPVLAEALGTVQPGLFPGATYAEVADAWGQVAIPEKTQRGIADEGDDDIGGVGAGGDLADGSGFGDGRSLPVFALTRGQLSALPSMGEPLHVIAFGDDSAEKAAAAAQVRAFLEMVVLGTTGQLASFLSDTLYIGPLRAIPQRGFFYEGAGHAADWADGLAAWSHLLQDRSGLIERTNGWLQRLTAGCGVVVQQLFDRDADAEALSEGHVDKTIRRLQLKTDAGAIVLPSEVGAGISQLVPVVVAAVASEENRLGFTLIEQPELHVHPAVQVNLGDLFIEAATREGGRRTFLVETHSEHLILRVLRRIRETTENELVDPAPAFTDDKLSVLYVESTPDGVRVRRLRVDENGEFVDRWPKGFFAERMEELL